MDDPCAAPVVEAAPLSDSSRVAIVRCDAAGQRLVGLGRVVRGALRPDAGVEVLAGDHVLPAPRGSAPLPPPRPARTLSVQLDSGAYVDTGLAVAGRAEVAWTMGLPLRVEARLGTVSLGWADTGVSWSHLGGTVGVGLDLRDVGVGLAGGVGPRTVDPIDLDATVAELDLWLRLGRSDATYARARVVAYFDPECWPGTDVCPGFRAWTSGGEGELGVRLSSRLALLGTFEAGDGGVWRGGPALEFLLVDPWQLRIGLGYGAFTANVDGAYQEVNGIGLTVGLRIRAKIGGP